MDCETENKGAKVALVTGAATGIGRATARALDEAGFSVMLIDKQTGVHAAGANLSRARSVVCDVGAPGSAELIMESTLSEFGRLDALVNNAGIGGANLPVTSLRRDLVQSVFEVNLFGMLELCREAEGALRESRGSIVNIGSLFAEHPVRLGAVYSMSKAAVHNLTRVLALEYGTAGIRVNAVAPGYILTEMHIQEVESQAESLGVSFEERLASLRAEVPLGRHGTPEDVADAVAWLLSDGSRYVHGQTLSVNGGLTFT